MSKFFNEENHGSDLESYSIGNKNLPYSIIDELMGKDLIGLNYDQLLKYSQPKNGDAFRVLSRLMVKLMMFYHLEI